MNDELTIKDQTTTIHSFGNEAVFSYLSEQELNKTLNRCCQSFSSFAKNDLKLTKENWVLNLNFVDSGEIKAINKEHRSKDKATDVLSFPMQDNLRAGEYDKFTNEIELGDLFICLEVCDQQAREHSISFREELVHLFFHGLLHLCGFDHELSEEEDLLMSEKEQKILDYFVG